MNYIRGWLNNERAEMKWQKIMGINEDTHTTSAIAVGTIKKGVTADDLTREFWKYNRGNYHTSWDWKSLLILTRYILKKKKYKIK